jgi:hypothetical protein
MFGRLVEGHAHCEDADGGVPEGKIGSLVWTCPNRRVGLVPGQQRVYVKAVPIELAGFVQKTELQVQSRRQFQVKYRPVLGDSTIDHVEDRPRSLDDKSRISADSGRGGAFPD